MRNIPVNLSGYKLRVVEEPSVKADQEGKVITAYGTNDPLFTVAVFAKPVATEDGYRGKGEELKITLSTEPGAVEEGELVELIGPTVSHWERDGRSGLTWKAQGLKTAR
ncbi:hypothetical protein [Micromonospora antibiotica]|uniref:Uncharacterized protein n=1 Tax=Micromonospora antibiotica TaxID=2807623 RepID=A0ABS3VAI7_9ACTN|nr:hypothetical protein [Micromonospora antibiotica]MBO4162635.1 hypothetical protein [Micromonospora antibiotica]